MKKSPTLKTDEWLAELETVFRHDDDEGYSSRELYGRFAERGWTKGRVDKMLRELHYQNRLIVGHRIEPRRDGSASRVPVYQLKKA